MIDFEKFKEFLLDLNPVNILLFSILNAILCLTWLFLCLRLDRGSPEPKKQILRAIFWGGFIVFPVLLITGPISTFIHKISQLNNIFQVFILSFMIDGLVEEWAKFSVLSEKFYSSKYFDEPRDGVIYGMVIGLGFSFVENFLYILTFTNLVEGLWIVILRGLATTFMHILTMGIIGYYLGLSKFTTLKKNKNKLIWQGLIIAILFHGFYNTVIRFGYNWTIIPLVLLLISTYLAIIIGLRKMNKLVRLPLDQKV